MLQDLGYALRTLRKTPGFTAIAAVSLALGIGANSAVFSLADGLVLRPLPVPNASHLIVIQSRLRGESIGGILNYSGVSYPDFVDLRKTSQSFDSMAASELSPFGFTVDKNALPRMKYGVLVSEDFFRVMGVQPALGRVFRPDDFQPAAAPAMLGYDLWKTEFAGSPDIVGRTIYLNGLAFTAIGVAPQNFPGPNPLINASLYVPISTLPRLTGDHHPNELERRTERGLTIDGRLKSGVTVKQAEAELGVISQQLASAYPDSNRSCVLSPATDLQSRLRQEPLDTDLIVFLMLLAFTVLLIACANVMNLMLSRGTARAREIAVRLAIGASRRRLIQQFLTESLLLALFGGAGGLLLAQAATDLFSQIRIPSDIPIVLNFGLDQRALWFTLLASMASCVLFGLLPAVRNTKTDLTPALKPGTAGSGRRHRFFGRSALVVAQVAGSLLLLVLASQCFRGASIVMAQPTGFRTDHILTANFDPSLARYTPAQTDEFYRQLLDKSRTFPGLRAASLTSSVPMLPGGGLLRIVPEGYQLPAGAQAASVVSSTVSEDYFNVLNIPIVAGRPFAATDRADSQLVAIVNQVFADKYFGKQDPVGRHIRVEVDNTNQQNVEIVGVARTSKYFFALEPPVDYVYLPVSQRQATAVTPPTAMTLMLYTTQPPAELTAPLRELVRSLDPGQPVIGIRTMQEIYDMRATKTLTVILSTIAGLGMLGLVLALIGLYGLMTYTVGLRQREIGIRMAIGANRGGVMRMVVKQGVTLGGIGVAIGVSLWLLISRPVMTLVGARSFSWTLLTLVAVGLMAVAGIGAYLPARRASLVDPTLVLRQE
jgi:predicted permease